ncbi:MAG: L-fucose:H+ symporter permease [Saprospiraceae bacterium]|nr:L-fucose:H+ symporter permease [Saprospiraceae bacterium]
MHSSNTPSRNPYLLPFALTCSLFFLWGIANSLNGSLVKQFQTALDLSRAQAGFVDSAFYLGYFVFAIPAGIFIRRYGFKKGILAGLLLYAGGALLFYPAAGVRVYAFFLFALFTIACGLAFLETAANLYVTVLGDKKDAAWRINFAQSFNGISIILGPAIGSFFIFSGADYSNEQLKAMPIEQSEPIRMAEALATRGPYLALAGVVLLAALIFWLSKLPEVGRDEEQGEAPRGLGQMLASIPGLLSKHRHLALGVLAQFANVGAQVTLWSYFVDLKMGFSNEEHLGIVQQLYPLEGKNLKQIAGFHASFAMALFMMGRFLGTFLMGRYEARRVMSWYSIGALLLVLLAYFTGGFTAMICVMLTYFCQSIMFPTIFALATKGLAPADSKLASSLVIMSIVGAAILPPIGGWLSHIELRYLLIVPFVCFGFVVYYAMRGYRE